MQESTGENSGEKLAEIRNLSKNLTDSGLFVKNLDKSDKKVYGDIVKRLRDDTRDELTATEYESLAKMSFFCDRFEALFRDTDPSQLDSELLEIYRKMKTQIVVFLRDYRQGKRVSPPSIVKIQNYLVNIKPELDELAKLEFKKKDTAEIIDITDLVEDG